jgi:hypothetical protein
LFLLSREVFERPRPDQEPHLSQLVFHKTDRRYRVATEREAWETEALGQSTVTALVRESLDSLLPEPLADVHVREEAEQEDAVAYLDQYAAEDGDLS